MGSNDLTSTPEVIEHHFSERKIMVNMYGKLTVNMQLHLFG